MSGGAVQRFFASLGSVLRSTGQAVDSLGCLLQGKYAYKETVSNHRTLQAFGASKPVLGSNCFVAHNASVVGDVKLGEGSSVWYSAVLRGDVNSISVGRDTNIQDGVVVHVAKNNPAGKAAPTTIGNSVTIGHNAMIHACTIQDGSLVGMGATILDGATVESGAVVAAGAVVLPGTTIPSGEVWAGVPAKLLRKLAPGEADFILQSAVDYTALAAQHAEENAKTQEEIELDNERREDRMYRDPDYDAHMGVLRDPITREIISVAGQN